MLEFQSISKSFSDTYLHLKNISLSVVPGEIIAVVGRNGVGKSTLLKLMNGLVTADSGQIIYRGQDISKMTDKTKRQMRKKVCYIFQNANLLGKKSVRYHLELVYRLDKVKPDQAKIDDILNFMGIAHLAKTKCQHLSGGQAQKVAIAMALLAEPEILLCDEISAALDSKSEKEIFALLAQLREERGLAIVMVAHNLTLLKYFCDRILVLEAGKIAQVLVPKKTQVSPYHEDYVAYVKEVLEA